MNKINNKVPVSVVMPMRNSSTTILHALESIEKQKYPIREIIIIDNASEDNSVEIVEGYSKKSKIPINLIVRDSNKGVGANINFGVKNAKSSLIILMHSDCSLPTTQEADKLTKPLRADVDVVATYPTIFLLQSVWDTYDFWEKSFFSREAGKEAAGLTGKFDCIRKNVYQKLNGFDVENFRLGGEDADLHERLRKIGKVTMSQAKVAHLHYLGKGFSFKEFLRKHREYGMIYGRLLRKRRGLFLGKSIVFLIKPFLAILPFLPMVNIIGMLLIVLYSVLYTEKMFTTKSTLKNPRIFILPFVNIFLLYYETYWMAESFLFGGNKIE